MSQHDTLVFNVILDWDDCAFNDGTSDVKQTVIKKEFVRVLRDTDVTMIKTDITFQEKNTSNLYYETSSIVRFTVSVRFEAPKTKIQVQKFLRKLLSRQDLQGIYLSLDSSCEEALYSELSLSEVSQRSKVKSFSLGTVVGVGNFVSYFDSTQVNAEQLQVKELEIHFRHDLANLHVQFFDPKPARMSANEVGSWYEMKIKYESIHSVVIHPLDDILEVLLVMKCPPLLYRKISYFDPAFNKRSAFIRESTFDMKSPPGVSSGSKRLSAQQFGKSNVLVVRLPLVKDETKKPWGVTCPWKMTCTLKRFLDLSTAIPFYWSRVSSTVQDKNLSPSFSSFAVKDDRQLYLPDFMLEKDNFDVYYALQCCVHLSHQFFADLTLPRNDGLQSDWSAFKSLLEYKFKENALAVEQTFYDIFHSLERNLFIHVLKDFSVLFDNNRVSYLSLSGMPRIRRAVLTPTRVILMPPHPFVISRFFTHCDASYAIRVQIRDDDGLQLPLNIGLGSPSDSQLNFLTKTVQNPIMLGIQIGPHRRYEFLASTSSQLRDHGLTVYTMDASHRRAKDLRKQIGDFSKIKCVGKHIARVGQAFSQMLSSLVIDEKTVLVKRIPDIKRGKHPESGEPYTFTDGVGKVSKSLAKRMAEAIGSEDIPSAFQIRYQGYKGLVVVDPTLPDNDILVLRPSMDKFPSESKSLEVLKVSKARAVYLNRPLICLLDQMGVDSDVLQLLLNISIRKLAHSFVNETVAVNMLSEYTPFLSGLLDIQTVSRSGISVLSDPLLRKTLDLIVRRTLKELKEKARIKIPFDSGRMMFGCVDEYGFLEYGQVFVQYSTLASKNPQVLRGPVMVTKNPCMHPGDVRLFTAVDCPCLRHITDCIVFPQNGDRPHPNEMAGSDLDGDEYSVIWLKELLISSNFEPMVFPDKEALEIQEEIQEKHLLDFICKFIQSNSVGLIAHAHLALADLVGIFNDQCFRYCEMYSIALDFAKTGLNCALNPEERPKHFPDFMAKGAERSTYMSDRALGRLYQRINTFDLAFSDNLREEDYVMDNDLLVQGWKRYEKTALRDFALYSARIASLLKEMSIVSEVSLLSTLLEKNSRFFSGKNDAAELKDMTEKIVKDAFDGFRQTFDDLGGDNVGQEERLKKASAYYVISFRMSQDNKATEGVIDMRKNLLGFHWIASKELAMIAKSKKIQEPLIETRDEASRHSIVFSNRRKIISMVDQQIIENITTENDLETLGQEDVALKVLRLWFKDHPIRDLRLIFHEQLLDQELQSQVKNAMKILRRTSSSEVTPGDLVIETLAWIINSWLIRPQTREHSLFGLASISTMNRIHQTMSIEALMKPRLVEKPLSLSGHHLEMRHFHISLVFCPEFQKLVRIFPSEVLDYLKRASDVMDITGNHHSQGSYQYWLITAVGTKWQLELLNNLIIQKNFYKSMMKNVPILMQKKKDNPNYWLL